MILDVIAVAILALYCITGFHKGFVRSLLGFASFFIAIALTIAFHGAVEGIVRSTSLDETITTSILEMGYDKTNEEFLAGLHLPQNVNETVQDRMGPAMESAASTLSDFIITLISSVGLFLVILIALKLVLPLVDGVAHLPVLNFANRVCGLALGAVTGAVVLFLLSTVLTLSAGTQTGQWCMEQLNASAFASFFYNNNFILGWIFR